MGAKWLVPGTLQSTDIPTHSEQHIQGGGAETSWPWGRCLGNKIYEECINQRLSYLHQRTLTYLGDLFSKWMMVNHSGNQLYMIIMTLYTVRIIKYNFTHVNILFCKLIIVNHLKRWLCFRGKNVFNSFKQRAPYSAELSIMVNG